MRAGIEADGTSATAHNEGSIRTRAGSVPCPVVLVSARSVVASDDSGRFEAVEPTIADGVGNVARAGNANSAGPELHNVVEPALARALMLAAEAGRWGLVAQIARELEERRRRPEHVFLSAIEDPTERKDAQRRR